jgi:AbrB family looped-hinge helix DNA binding protein
MRTKISTKGQVVLPSQIRRKLGLQPGDPLDAELDGERIVLIPRRTRRAVARIIKDPVTGLPVLTVGADAPELTNAQVREILAEFP